MMRRSSKRDNDKRTYLTVEDRIILYLKDYVNFEDHLEVPQDITQVGIAQAVMIQRSAVPRAMNNLISKNIAYTKKVHVRGMKRRRKVYFLTSHGIEYAERILKRFIKRDIDLRYSGNKITMTLGDLLEDLNRNLANNEEILSKLRTLSKERLNVLDLANIIASNRITFPMNLEDLYSMAQKYINQKWSQRIRTDIKDSVTSETIQKPEIFGMGMSLRRPEICLGRGDVIEQICLWIKDEKVRFIAIYGIAGVGKTTVISKIVYDFLIGNYLIFYYRMHVWDTMMEFATEFNEFLKSFGMECIDFKKGFGHVRHELQRKIGGLSNVIFIFDDFHLIQNRGLRDIIHVFMEVCEDLTNVKLIIASRDRIFNATEKYLIQGLAKEIMLNGLSREHTRELASRLNFFIESDIDPYEISKGNPLVLQIIAQSDYRGKTHEVLASVERFLSEEVFDMLSIKEKHLLGAMSVWREGIIRDDILRPIVSTNNGGDVIDNLPEYTLADIESVEFPGSIFNWNQEAWNSLVDKGIITSDGKGNYNIHELLDNIVYNYIGTRERRWYHLYAAVTYLHKISTQRADENLGQHIYEILYHLIKARAFKAAAQIILRFSHVIFKDRRIEAIAKMAREIINYNIQKEILDSREFAVVYILLAKASYFTGKFHECDGYLMNALEKLEDKGERGFHSFIYYELGRIYTKRGDMERARHNLDLALESLQNDVTGLEEWRIYGAIGDTYWMQSDYSNALRYFLKATKTFERRYGIPSTIRDLLKTATDVALKESIEKGTSLIEVGISKLQRYLGPEREGMFNIVGDYYFKIIFCINANKLFSNRDIF